MQTQVIDKQRHKRLLDDLQGVCEVAGVPQHLIYESATGYLTDQEVQWLRTFPVNQRKGLGLCLVGEQKLSPDLKLQSIAAALLRNYIDARVIPLNALLEAHENREMPEPTVLLIPNLFQPVLGKSIPSWRVQVVYDLLLQRQTQGLISVVYVEDLEKLGQMYGLAFQQHLEQHYLIAG